VPAGLGRSGAALPSAWVSVANDVAGIIGLTLSAGTPGFIGA
jgi:hypothetical protein